MLYTMPKRIKLWCDDIRKEPEGWTLVTTVTEAIRFIAMFGTDIKEISLDHDISHQVAVGKLSRPYPCEETFVPVAYFINEYYSGSYMGSIPKITIHTANPVGAETLESVLKDFAYEIKMMKPANRLEHHD